MSSHFVASLKRLELHSGACGYCGKRQKGASTLTIYPYRTTHTGIKTRITAEKKRRAEQQAILNTIARNAVVDYEILEPVEANFEFDAMGNVIIKGQQNALNGTNGNGQRPIIRIPQEEAYQRIVEATYNKIELLEHLYEISRAEARRWFKRSLFSALSEALLLTFSIFIPSLGLTFQRVYYPTPFIDLLVGINVLHALLTLWIFYKNRCANNLVDLYVHSLHDIRNFASITHFLSRLQLDKDQKQLLQKALVSRSLGLPASHINTYI